MELFECLATNPEVFPDDLGLCTTLPNIANHR